MEIIAFSGYARSGKDTSAEALADLGWTRIAFADKLRNFLYTLNPRITDHVRVTDVVQMFGWNGYKETQYGDEIRALLQRLGTDCGRNLLYDNVWVDATFGDLDENGKYVVTDCRFLNEANAVRNRGGKIYRIERAGVGPANDHISEVALDDYDFDGIVKNDGSLDDFYSKVRSLV